MKVGYIGTSLHSNHQDEGIYEDTDEFEPWTFVEIDMDKDHDGHEYISVCRNKPGILSPRSWEARLVSV